MKTHMTPAKPPNRSAVAEAAQTVLLSMPWGVISLTHCSGCAASGMIKPSYEAMLGLTSGRENVS